MYQLIDACGTRLLPFLWLIVSFVALWSRLQRYSYMFSFPWLFWSFFGLIPMLSILSMSLWYNNVINCHYDKWVFNIITYTKMAQKTSVLVILTAVHMHAVPARRVAALCFALKHALCKRWKRIIWLTFQHSGCELASGSHCAWWCWLCRGCSVRMSLCRWCCD